MNVDKQKNQIKQNKIPNKIFFCNKYFFFIDGKLNAILIKKSKYKFYQSGNLIKTISINNVFKYKC